MNLQIPTNLCNCVKKPEKKFFSRLIAFHCDDLFFISFHSALTCSQGQWLHSSVGRASHRYHEV